MLKWVKHLNTVILNIQEKKHFLRFSSEKKKKSYINHKAIW